MTDSLLLNWGLMALSLANTILLFWLALTVLLNSDWRVWGIWLAGGGLLLGAAFFVSHSVIFGLSLTILGWDMIFWWTVGLVPALALPFAWYVSMLWYAGYWGDRRSGLHRRHGSWLRLVVMLLALGFAGLVAGILLLAVPPIRFEQLRLFLRWSVAGVPLLSLGYSVYVVLCISLSLDVLRRPGPSARVMGSLARRRARPWLVASSWGRPLSLMRSLQERRCQGGGCYHIGVAIHYAAG